MENSQNESWAVLFSGGTDSTCAAAVCAEDSKRIHLLTYSEQSTKSSPVPVDNYQRLIRRFPSVEFTLTVFDIDAIVRFLQYEQYLKNIYDHGLLVLATPAFSSLSWHLQTLRYCVDHNIKNVSDGLTRELIHFPGHMDVFIENIRLLYKEFGINYCNTVRDWDVPSDKSLLDRFVVDRHGFMFPSEEDSVKQKKTTGRYLFDLGLFPVDNIKGSKLDQSMQHDCYPFVLYNMMAFWIFLSRMSYSEFCDKIEKLIKSKIDVLRPELIKHISNRDSIFKKVVIQNEF